MSLRSDNVEEELVEEIDPDLELKPYAKFFSIITLLLLCMLSSILIPSIRSVFSIVGVTAGNLIAFILPSSFYLKIISE